MSALPPKADIGPHRDGIDAPGYSRDRNSEVATDRQCGEFFAAASKEHVADGHQPVCPQLVQGRKSPIEIAFGAGLQDMNLQAERAGGRLQTFQKSIGTGICRVDEQSYNLGTWDRVMQ